MVKIFWSGLAAVGDVGAEVFEAGDAFDVPSGGAEGGGFGLFAAFEGGGVEDDGDVVVVGVLAAVADEFEAGHFGHGFVDDHAAGAVVGEEFEGGGAGGGDVGVHAVAAEV